jgi:PTH1 family peptidyl-tRNA hydrolase
MSDKLSAIAGLGNPGDRYAETLHNAGFWCVDEIARRAGVSFAYEKRFDAEVCKVPLHGDDVWLIKPQSYMNESGRPVRALLDYYDVAVEELLVVHDEIDLPPGRLRLKQGGGHGGHNGLRDLIRHCGSDFMRLRFGVGHPGEKHQVTGYVLKKADSDLRPILERSVDDAADIVAVLAQKGLNEAMKELHTGSR